MSSCRFYECKVLTPEFKIKLDAEIKRAVEERLKEKNIPSDRPSYAAEFHRMEIRDLFISVWHHPEEFEKIAEMKSYLESVGLWTPEFTITKFEARDSPSQVQARIQWNDKIRKIDDIDEIISFERKEALMA